jgi:glycosyltransferase involved in cell wall biosynthesis
VKGPPLLPAVLRLAQVFAGVQRGPAPATKIAYDARYATAEPTGIGQVCVELLRGLAELPGCPPLTVLVDRTTRLPDDLWAREPLRVCQVPFGPYGPANQFGLPRLLWRRGVRLLHGIDGHNPLVAPGVRLVVNVHDLIPLACAPHAPRSRKARFRRAWRLWLKWQCARAARVVCGSRHAAGDVVRWLGVDPAKVTVIPNPVREWAATEPPERLRRRLGLRGRVVAYVGRQEPYKNVTALVRAVPHLNRLLGDERVQFVLAGRLDDRYPEARAEADRLGLAGQVVFPGYLDEAALGALYRLSAAFVFPSLYEGFGMPPLEAMRFGTPVVAGRHACLPEVLGDAALYTDTTDPLALARAIAAVLQDPDLAGRLRAAGLRQVRQFSRRRAARAYLRLYEDVLNGPGPLSTAAITLEPERAGTPGGNCSRTL